ncbi:MAG: DUF1961 family protein [Candidatus Merdivicinus sp.]|jgi:hypothetical protein
MEKTLIYQNPLEKASDVEGFVMEGEASVTFENGRMQMKNLLDPSLGQKSNFVYWCPEIFPADVEITWDFYPLQEPGLCMLFFAATGIHGEDLFDPSLAKRDGQYRGYHSGDINAFHVSYFRRKQADERAFHTCNLRKSKGFYLVAQGADPIPDADEAVNPYHIRLIKKGNEIRFLINDLESFRFVDDGTTYGPLFGGGRIGFRQMAPMIAEYSNLCVYAI